MKKAIFISTLFFSLLIISGCTDNKGIELSEEEKKILDISYEKGIYDEVFNVANNEEPIKVTTEGIELFDFKEFKKFIPENGDVLAVSRHTIDGMTNITIEYTIPGKQRFYSTYFENGKVNKTTKTNYILNNFNNEEFTKLKLD